MGSLHHAPCIPFHPSPLCLGLSPFLTLAPPFPVAGCTHFIIGRDMAGCKSCLTGDDFYGEQAVFACNTGAAVGTTAAAAVGQGWGGMDFVLLRVY